MSIYYMGRWKQHSNARWCTFTEKALAKTLTMIDVTALCSVSEELGRLPRLLEVAYGTGILLKKGA